MANGSEEIFTPIRRDLPSPLYQPINNYQNGKKEESIIFEQSMEKESDLLDTSHEKKPRKKNSSLIVSNDMIGEQFIYREIKSENEPNNNENKKDFSEKKDEKDLLEENNNETKFTNNDVNDDNKKEEKKKDIDLFISIDAYAI